MLEIPAKTIYIDPAVRAKPNCLSRLEAMLPHFRCQDVRDLEPGGLDRIRAIGKRRHGKDDFGDECIVAFTDFEPRQMAWYHNYRDGGEYFRSYGGYCQSALELNIVDGCVFRCAYCGFGRYIIIPLDVERYIAGLDEVFARYPQQTLFKYSNMTDLPPFEPQYNAVPPMVELFGRQDSRYLMLFTKSDNVDFLLPLKHGGKTIVSWSMSCETASRLVDRRTATMDQRIEAMRKCQQAGYTVRARLSPIVPVKNWRQEYEALFERMFSRCRPDIVTLELLGWMDFDDLVKLLPPDVLDAEALAAAQAAKEELRGQHGGPFTEQTHQDVYRFCAETVRRISPQTRVSFCHGTSETWAALGSLTGMAPNEFVCNCGGLCTPGHKLLFRTDGNGVRI